MSKKPDLKAMFHSMVVDAIDENGIFPHICLSVESDGFLTVEALALDYPQVLQHVQKLRLENGVRELIFGIDRSTKEGQGTEFKDVLTCAYWRLQKKQIAKLTDGAWEIGVINYQPPPAQKIIRPWDWNNEFWHKQMMKEIRANDARYERLAEQIQSSQANNTKNPAEGRPDDIMPEELAKWTEGFNRWCEGPEPPPITSEETRQFYLEMSISADWLARELHKLGADQKAIESQQAVAGQRTFLNTIWGATKMVLENYKKGIIEQPGPELAQKIMLEQVQGGRMRIEGRNVIFKMGK